MNLVSKAQSLLFNVVISDSDSDSDFHIEL